MLRYFPSIPSFWRVFNINGCWILSKAFSASIEIIIWFLFFNLLMWCMTLIDLWILKNPCIPGIKPTWSSRKNSLLLGSASPDTWYSLLLQELMRWYVASSSQCPLFSKHLTHSDFILCFIFLIFSLTLFCYFNFSHIFSKWDYKTCRGRELCLVHFLSLSIMPYKKILIVR